MMDISMVHVVLEQGRSSCEKETAMVFRDMVKKRSGIEIPVSPTPGLVSIGFYTEDSFAVYQKEFVPLLKEIPSTGAEGFKIKVSVSGIRKAIWVVGHDERGTFYGMARILRKIYAKNGQILYPEAIDGLSVTPEYPIRGHQLGYRDKQNTCPAWGMKEYATYIRDLELFGANSIELLPPRTDDALYSSLFSTDPHEMMIGLSRIIHSYHMDVWLWYPNLGTGYDTQEKMEKEIREREQVFAEIPYLDAVSIPFGDPGSLFPTEAFRVTAVFAQILKKYHPEATIWIAPQHFQPEPGWYDAFYAELKKEPVWLTGVCFAPWEQDSIQDLVKKIPAKYRTRIRNYPDITHNTNCQFPVPEWDDAFALTLGREGNNMRPEGMKRIHNFHAKCTVGSITYSEGIHDDVNKMIWCDQDFSTKMSTRETVEDYVRMFVDGDLVKELSDVIFQTERSWVGPITKNTGIDDNYRLMRRLDAEVDEQVKRNFRYQMIKLRVLSDYYTKYKYLDDQKNECDAKKILSEANKRGSLAAIKEARSIFHKSYDEMKEEALLHEMQKLSDDLFASCRIRLTVTHHHGQSWIRGAYLETAWMPLNDYQFYMEMFKRIVKMPSEPQRLEAISSVLHRTDPPKGSFYYNLGSFEGFSHVKQWEKWDEDPGYLHSPMMDHSIYNIMGFFHHMQGWYDEFPLPLSWTRNAEVIYGTPLEATFGGLDPHVAYKLRVIYPTQFFKAVFLLQKQVEPTSATLYAGDCLLAKEIPCIPIGSDAYWEYELPPESYKDGTLTLRWQIHDTLGPLGVSDLWLLKKEENKDESQ